MLSKGASADSIRHFDAGRAFIYDALRDHNHYVSLAGNYAKQEANFFDILGGNDIWGGGVGYSYDSIVGPIDFVFSLSDWSKKLGFYFNLGYYF